MKTALLALSLSLASLPLTHTQETTKENAILLAEENFWTAYAAGDSGALDKLLLPEFTNVEQEIWDRQQVLNFVTKFHSMCSLAPVKIQAPKVSFTAPDTAIIVYHAVETPTCGGKSMSGDTNISTVYLLRDGRWQMRLHTEYALPPK